MIGLLDYSKSFIEVQFPVSKVSKESYKERKAVQSQTLPRLGKWWGRKPLILVRAALLGLLMPTSHNPEKDRDIFLKVLTMDESGLVKRKNKNIPTKELWKLLTPDERKTFLEDNKGKIVWEKDLTGSEKQSVQLLAFKRMSYDEKLDYCCRPEQTPGLLDEEWDEINARYDTTAKNIRDFVRQLGVKRFGHFPIVGDCFSGGGSVPFEATRLGTDVYASDLNPIAGLLTWVALQLTQCSDADIQDLRKFQEEVFDLVDRRVTEWGIEHDESGDMANAFLYCTEARCPECGYMVPLAASWVVGPSSGVVALLVDNGNKGFDIEIVPGASKEQIDLARSLATFRNGNLVCPNPECETHSPIAAIRGDRKFDGTIVSGLREWEPTQFVSRPDDVFHERLYCIRYEREYLDDSGKKRTERYYRAPSKSDFEREKKVERLLRERFDDWQTKGYLPISRIESGYNTDQPLRERGWTYWHHLFTPRQLLVHGLFMQTVDDVSGSRLQKAIGLLGVNRCLNWNSRLCQWGVGEARESIAQTFYNQAFNTFFNYAGKGLGLLKGSWYIDPECALSEGKPSVDVLDAREIDQDVDLWITDPPYADAVNYHELSEFFLAWDKVALKGLFPSWPIDSRRPLAIKGIGYDFSESMIEVYRNLTTHMSRNGLQIVMFTHQNVSVWADLALILWSSGLKVTAAWNIATETESGGINQGNYVKATVLLVLRKQASDVRANLDELYPEIEEQVRMQIDNMKALDDKEDPNFSDADYLLAAYAASLKVLTSYKQIEDIDVAYELSKARESRGESPIEKIINQAVKIAYDYLTPSGFDSYSWKLLTAEERFFIKGLDFETDGIKQIGAYQELARGFGVSDYKELLASTRANQARLKTASEHAMRGIGGTDGFATSLLRNVLAALYQCIKAENALSGKNWLRNEVTDYWNQRTLIMELLDFIAALGEFDDMEHWKEEAHYARMLRELVKNDGV